MLICRHEFPSHNRRDAVGRDAFEEGMVSNDIMFEAPCC